MSQQIDLKEIERQAYRANFQDGLWDILLGFLLLQMAFGPFLYRLGWSPAWILMLMVGFVTLLLIVFRALKKFVITPRLGLVNFGPARQAQKKKQSLILTLAMLLGIVILIISVIAYQFISNDPATAVYPMALILFSGLILAVAVVAFSVVGFINDFPRAYLYGWFYGLAFPLNIMLDNQYGITFPVATVLFAAVMIIIGLVLFVRFLQSYPLSAQGVLDD